MIHGFAVIWITMKIPRMGNLAGGGNLVALDSLYRKGLIISLLSWLFFATSAVGGLLVLSSWDHPILSRMGSIAELLVWILGGFAFLWCFLRGSYVRAFCKEPFAKLNLVRAILTLLLLLCFLPLIGREGAGIAYFVSMLVGALFFEKIYRKSRQTSDVLADMTASAP